MTKRLARPVATMKIVSLNWDQCREHYRRYYTDAKQRRGVRQADVARRGGLSGQNAISMLLAPTSRRGPTVDNFLRALAGLGLTPASFFRTLEQREDVLGRSIDDRFDAIEQQVAALQRPCPTCGAAVAGGDHGA